MPKVIENASEQIIKAGKDVLAEKGFDDFNMRDVAKKCQMAIGTLYNYFPSKDGLIAKILFLDWNEYLNEVNMDAESGDDLFTCLNLIFDDLVDFVLKYEELYKKRLEISDFSYEDNSISLDLQIVISNLIKKYGYSVSDFEEAFIAEAFLFYAVRRDFSYSKLDMVIHKIIKP